MAATVRACWLPLVVCGSLTVGCRPASSASSATQPAAVAIALRSPQEATRSLLELLRAHLQAIARHDRKAAEYYRDQVAAELVARADVLARFDTLPGRVTHDANEMLKRLVESWAAVVSFYADGLEPERMRLGAVDGEGSKVVVDVPARGPAGEAILRVLCQRGPDEQWRVTSIEFAPPAPHGPTTAPTHTAPATGPSAPPATQSAPS